MKNFLIKLMVLALLGLGLSVGTASLAAATSNPNDANYWTNYGPHAATCYKHDSSVGSNDHGTSNGAYVVLNTFNQNWPGDHWELLVVKGGSEGSDGNGDAIYVHPQAGVAYYPPTNHGGQIAAVSHWIVCKGTTPPVVTTTTTTIPPTTTTTPTTTTQPPVTTTSTLPPETTQPPVTTEAPTTTTEAPTTTTEAPQMTVVYPPTEPTTTVAVDIPPVPTTEAPVLTVPEIPTALPATGRNVAGFVYGAIILIVLGLILVSARRKTL